MIGVPLLPVDVASGATGVGAIAAAAIGIGAGWVVEVTTAGAQLTGAFAICRLTGALATVFLLFVE